MSIFAGMTRDQLQAALTSAQSALIELRSGKKVVTASYTQGDGAKSVTFRPGNIGDLTAMILQLQAALGVRCTRRPMRPVYL